jgi:cytochrome c-type biogenesis protein CcmE
LLKKKKFLIGGIVIGIAVVYLAITGFMQSSQYYDKVSELVGMGSAAYGQHRNVSGTVVEGSIKYDVNTMTETFTLTEGGQSVPVVYHGAPPDTLKPDADVVVGGYLDETGVYQADEVVGKCASKYVPEK